MGGVSQNSIQRRESELTINLRRNFAMLHPLTFTHLQYSMEEG
jgi:hypothetical protein